MENKKGKLGSRLAGSEAFLSVAASLICIVIGLLLGLVVLAGIALAVLTASNRKAEQAASEAADGSIPVLAIPSDTVRKIQMEAQSGTLTLAYADGSWSLAEDPDYHLDESSCNAMLTAVSALNAKRELQEAAGEDYGFSAPEATVSITTDVTGDVYLQKAGESAVYTVASSKLNCFLKDKAALFGAFSPAGLTSSAIEAVSYTLADGETVSLKAMSEPVESAGSGTSEAASDSTAYQTVWRLENDPTADLDTDKTDAILTALSSYVSGQITPADGADLAAAGFDTPLVTVQVTTAEKTVTLRYASGMDGYYLMVEGDGSLYTVDQSTVQALLLPENAGKIHLLSAVQYAGSPSPP